jgi:ATP-dependent RNA helicase DeaD
MSEETTDTQATASADLPAAPHPSAQDSAPINVTTTEVTTTFEDWDLVPELLKALEDMGYERPMPVQEAVYKTLHAGKDLMVQSKTGSGKTAAFGIPTAQILAGGKKGVQSLILAPTRELAMQVAKEIEKLCANMDVMVVPVYGGAPINPQIKKLEDGAQIVAGTPGRVLDHIRRGTLKTGGIQMLVLDECDEMLSMGFQEEIENIISTLPAKEERQTLLFSATIPKEIERIGRRHMRDPEMVSLSSDSIGAELIDHYYYVVSGMARTRDLLKLMKAERPESAIIFCNTREETNSVARYLQRHGYDAEALSSDLSQSDRERVMGRMKAKNLNFLVATDIAARGIDISELSHVINYTFPGSPEVYVHRSGRTGRAGKQGTALSLVGPREIGAFYYLKLIYKIIPTERDLPTAEEMATIEEGEQYLKVIGKVDGSPKSEFVGLARRLWQSTEGERVVALLLQELLTEKKAAPTRAPVSEAKSPRRSARASEAPAAADEQEDGRKRRRRRRRGAEAEAKSEEETKVEAKEVPAEAPPVESPDAATAAVDPTTPAQETDAITVEVATRDYETELKAEEGQALKAAEEAEEEKPKRKRRRRRRSESEAEELEAKETESSEEPEAAAEEAEAAEPAADKDPDTVDAVHEALEAKDEEEEPPKRKRRRRRGAKSAESEEETGAEAKKADGDADAVKAKARKRRPRKPNSTPGAHAEFWEAWAETKNDDDDSSEESEPEVEAEASEEEAAPKKKRSRKRRSKKEQAEEETEEEVEPDSVRLFVNVGRREDADVEEIRAFLSEALGETTDALGKITLRNTHCYVRVHESIVDALIEACTGLIFHDREMVVERAKR